jgi:transposase-like protein
VEENKRKYKEYQGRRSRYFEEDFKLQAVQLLERGDRSLKQLCQELRVSEWSLRQWKKRYGKAVAANAGSDLEQENARLRRELETVRTEREILKKSLSHLGPGTVQRYQIISQLRSQGGYHVEQLCQVLEVSRSGFYDHGKKAQRPRRQQDSLLAERLRGLFLQSRQTYGCLRLQHALRQQQIRCGKNRIARLMKAHQLRPRQKRRFRPKTTHSQHWRPVAANRLLELAQAPAKPDQVWVADITYLPAQGRQSWFYLALEMDLYSRRIAGWKVGLSLQHYRGRGRARGGLLNFGF